METIKKSVSHFRRIRVKKDQTSDTVGTGGFDNVAEILYHPIIYKKKTRSLVGFVILSELSNERDLEIFARDVLFACSLNKRDPKLDEINCSQSCPTCGACK